MSLGIPYRVFALLAEAARKEQEYDYIVIDADSVFDEEKAALMQLADKMIDRDKTDGICGEGNE